MSILTDSRPAFDVSVLDFVSMGLLPLDELPEFHPSAEDQIWALGYELEQTGERAKLSDRDGYTPAQHLAFANGQRQARADVRPEPKLKPPTSADLVAGLINTAAWCEGQGGQVGRFLTALIRDAAGDVELFGARSWNEYDGRRQVMLDSLSYCHECATRNHDDKH